MSAKEIEALAFDGFDALVERLGPVGAIHFIRLCSQGITDYTAQRHHWLGKLDLARMVRQAKKRDRRGE
ncbi:MAG: hypothetical protein FJ279_34750 [Planctomycetes bacterium]|nr:hypothetical protein [Planctomycetota bacterium]